MLETDAEAALRRGAAIYPQPVAQACAALLRARSEESLVDATLKAAEVLTRYAAILGIASWAAREQVDASTPHSVAAWDGPLAWGVFLSAAVQLATCKTEHPLRSQLVGGFAQKGKQKSKRPGAAAANLTSLLELRNHLGHDLSSVTQGRAIAILRDQNPVEQLVGAFEALGGLLDHPLFIVEDQQVVGGKIRARRLLLMGDGSDPEPEEIVLSNGLHFLGSPYVGLKSTAICLRPLSAWDVAPESHNYRLYIIDAVDGNQAKYKALNAQPRVLAAADAEIVTTFISDATVAAEPVTLEHGAGLSREWRERRQRTEDLFREREGMVPWDQLDENTLGWYARRLDKDVDADRVRAVITELLLDAREHLVSRDLDQLILLFGSDQMVRRLVGRQMIDLRALGEFDTRWVERSEHSGNVIESLRAAVSFFERHVGVEGASLDGLHQTSGSADYIAMREALVNMFIHQDYSDASAAAQVEVAPERTVFFNPGAALVPEDALLEGGRSQARNPLIARSLRLIGFAELAGSGLREVHRNWRDLKRRPPTVMSDREGNTFTLTLDWRTIPQVYDQYWKGKIGVELKPDEAKILDLAFDDAGVTVQQAASGCGLLVADAEDAIRTLLRQALVEENGGSYQVKPHLRELVQE